MHPIWLAICAGFIALVSISAAAAPISHFANADDDAAVVKGSQIYRERCAACHGRHLEGQPLWQLQDQFMHRRAPAHDASGHTWQHSDEDLFEMTKTGRFPGVPMSIHSYMPAFGAYLNNSEILDVLAYIKATWPLGIRVSQSMLNPNFRGMPRDANKVEWTLPPTCTSSYKRWKVISR
jgi:S-disulfanyl-L-cysteine oxidoreductase SoxD